MGAVSLSRDNRLLPGERFAGLAAHAAYRAMRVAAALQQQRLVDAERELARLDAGAFQHPEVLRLLGTLRLMRGLAADALSALAAASARRQNDPLLFDALGAAHERLGDYTQALIASQRACELAPDIATCWFNRARVLHAVGRIDDAVGAWRRVLALAPRHVNARVMLADVLGARGRRDEAQAQYRAIVRQHPGNCGMAWWGLAALRPLPLDAADVPVLRQSLQAAGGTEQHYIATRFALAHVLEQQGDYARAYMELGAAHARARDGQPWDAAEFSAQAQALLDAFSAQRPRIESMQGREAIFVTSLPRSGSTLVEQILASHSLVHGGGELPILRQLLIDESAQRRMPLPQWLRHATPADWHGLGRRYLARTAPLRQPRARLTDKMPGNWLYIGAILSMLPQARIVVVRRDPLETATACYRYYFTSQAHTHDFADLAAFQRDFDRAVRHWHELYPGRIHEVVSEDLAADPETRIRQLLAFCDLPFESACLYPQMTRRHVATPSASQVREPIQRVPRRAELYGALLDPLREALGVASLRTA